jgi:hypothetical protein
MLAPQWAGRSDLQLRSPQGCCPVSAIASWFSEAAIPVSARSNRRAAGRQRAQRGLSLKEACLDRFQVRSVTRRVNEQMAVGVHRHLDRAVPHLRPQLAIDLIDRSGRVDKMNEGNLICWIRARYSFHSQRHLYAGVLIDEGVIAKRVQTRIVANGNEATLGGSMPPALGAAAGSTPFRPYRSESPSWSC